MKKYLPVILFILLILLMGLSYLVISQTKTLFSRASENSEPSEALSSLYVNPLEAQCHEADTTGMIRINVFVTDSTGRPVIGAKVAISSTDKVSVIGKGVSDNFGRAVFDATCQIPADSYLPVLVNGKAIPTKVHLVFK